jgi:hypothetical protein
LGLRDSAEFDEQLAYSLMGTSLEFQSRPELRLRNQFHPDQNLAQPCSHIRQVPELPDGPFSMGRGAESAATVCDVAARVKILAAAPQVGLEQSKAGQFHDVFLRTVGLFDAGPNAPGVSLTYVIG